MSRRLLSKSWAEEELRGIDLGDERLNKRSVKLLKTMGEKPTASIPHACNGWGETQAAYRFFAQEDIGWEDILSPHSEFVKLVVAWILAFRLPF